MPIAAEQWMRLDGDDDKEMPRRSTVGSRFTLTRKTNFTAIIHARRYFDRNLARDLNAFLTVTFVAGCIDDFAFASAARAYGHVDELSKNRLAGASYFASAATLRTTYRCRARLGIAGRRRSVRRQIDVAGDIDGVNATAWRHHSLVRRRHRPRADIQARAGGSGPTCTGAPFHRSPRR